MNTNKTVTLIVVIVAGIFLAIRATTGEFGRVYTKTKTVEFTKKVRDSVGDSVQPWEVERLVERSDVYDAEGQPRPDVHLSISRTLGLWIAAFGTLCIMSFLIGDNVFYKLAEAVVVGTSLR